MYGHTGALFSALDGKADLALRDFVLRGLHRAQPRLAELLKTAHKCLLSDGCGESLGKTCTEGLFLRTICGFATRFKGLHKYYRRGESRMLRL